MPFDLRPEPPQMFANSMQAKCLKLRQCTFRSSYTLVSASASPRRQWDICCVQCSFQLPHIRRQISTPGLAASHLCAHVVRHACCRRPNPCGLPRISCLLASSCGGGVGGA